MVKQEHTEGSAPKLTLSPREAERILQDFSKLSPAARRRAKADPASYLGESGISLGAETVVTFMSGPADTIFDQAAGILQLPRRRPMFCVRSCSRRGGIIRCEMICLPG